MTIMSPDAAAILAPTPGVLGMPLQVFRNADEPADRTNHGLSSRVTRVTLIGMVAAGFNNQFAEVPTWRISEPTPDAPPVVAVLSTQHSNHQLYAWLEPAIVRGDGQIFRDVRHFSHGGNYAGTSDPRFREILTAHLGYPAPYLLGITDYR